MEYEEIAALGSHTREEIGKIIVGRDDQVQLMLTSLLCQGHVLLEGAPGTAKTFLVQTFSACLSLGFGRIQFTPDLMPADILGTNIYNFETNRFALTRGPIFTQILLADEINRSPPKTQAAMLQAMAERRITLDNKDHDLGDNFLVVATQNPVEHQGTYPLPEAQLDRFLFKILIDYPSIEEETEIIKRHGARVTLPDRKDLAVTQTFTEAELAEIRAKIRAVTLSEKIIDYLARLMQETRRDPSLSLGASPRAATMISASARGWAALDGRDYVVPDDIKALLKPALRHRLILTPEAELNRLSPDAVVEKIMNRVKAPK